MLKHLTINIAENHIDPEGAKGLGLSLTQMNFLESLKLEIGNKNYIGIEGANAFS